MAKTKATNAPSIPHTTPGQRLLIIEWLKVLENFKLITGSAAHNKAVVSGSKLKKSEAYKSLAEFISSKSKPVVWDAKCAKNRYEGYVDKYKKAKKVGSHH